MCCSKTAISGKWSKSSIAKTKLCRGWLQIAEADQDLLEKKQDREINKPPFAYN
jgi:hypothetical protein